MGPMAEPSSCILYKNSPSRQIDGRSYDFYNHTLTGTVRVVIVHIELESRNSKYDNTGRRMPKYISRELNYSKQENKFLMLSLCFD